MSIIMRTKIQTQLGCVNVVCRQDRDVSGPCHIYTAELLVRDGKVLQCNLAYPILAAVGPQYDLWDLVKYRLLQGLAREAFKEVK